MRKRTTIKNMPQEGWTVLTLKEHIEKILDERDKRYDERFRAGEVAIDKAEENRDTAIKKAEDSIEKKSDAVYVKLTDLQDALAKVMLRPEVEARFTGLGEKIDDLKTSRDTGAGKGLGMTQFWSMAVGAILFAIALYNFLNK